MQNDNPYNPPACPPPNLATRDILRQMPVRARNAWFVPVLIWMVTIGVGWMPGAEVLPRSLFVVFNLARLISLVWGSLRALSVWKYRKHVPAVVPHAIAAFLLCGIPTIVGAVFFVIAFTTP